VAKKFVGGALAFSVASIVVLAGCTGGSRLTPTVNAGGPAAPAAAWAPNAVGPVVYKGPKVANKPEVDLYSTTPATAGYSATFTLTQKGGTGAFKYAFKAVPGYANNCPKTASASYAISPASKKKAKKGKYTVKAAGKGIAGACSVTFTGTSKKTLKLLLTFTTSGVVVGQTGLAPGH
jgi:hypothetical protein